MAGSGAGAMPDNALSEMNAVTKDIGTDRQGEVDVNRNNTKQKLKIYSGSRQEEIIEIIVL